MRLLTYKLNADHSVEPCSMEEWRQLHEGPGNPRRVDRYEFDGGMVSTVFLGLDHGWGEGPPILFETMVFGGPLDQEMERYCTWDEAVAGHERWVQRVKEG